MKSPHRMPARPVSRHGFTLVELMVVVVIIGILLGLVVPATMRAIQRAKETTIRMEINALSNAAEQYQQRYNDYPPDMSSWNVAERHIRRQFQRLSPRDLTLIYNACHPNSTISTPTANPSGATFDPTAIDRGKALVLFLGGFSEDISNPFTGAGGPLEQVGNLGSNSVNLADFQYNTARDNAFFDFDPTRLSLNVSTPGTPLRSTDGSPFPTFFTSGRKAPIVYFDSRTYGFINEPNMANVSPFNGYANGQNGAIRPYKTDTPKTPPGGAYGSQPGASLASWEWQNPDTFQIISAGNDDLFGTAVHRPLTDPQGVNNPSSSPVYFMFPSGRLMTDVPGASTPNDTLVPNVRAYQEIDRVSGARMNGHLDNITNFSTSTLESDLP